MSGVSDQGSLHANISPLGLKIRKDSPNNTCASSGPLVVVQEGEREVVGGIHDAPGLGADDPVVQGGEEVLPCGGGGDGPGTWKVAAHPHGPLAQQRERFGTVPHFLHLHKWVLCITGPKNKNYSFAKLSKGALVHLQKIHTDDAFASLCNTSTHKIISSVL